jgi:hypothetical protein
MTSTTENTSTENESTKSLEIAKIESDRQLILEAIENEVKILMTDLAYYNEFHGFRSR